MNFISAHPVAQAWADKPDEPKADYKNYNSENVAWPAGDEPFVKFLVKFFYFHKSEAKLKIFLFAVDSYKKFRPFKKDPFHYLDLDVFCCFC